MSEQQKSVPVDNSYIGRPAPVMPPAKVQGGHNGKPTTPTKSVLPPPPPPKKKG
jgi:hypothetical protein